MVDFTLTPAQQELRRNAAAFAQAHLKGASAIYAHLPTQQQRFEATRPLYRAAVQAGLIRGQVPAALGGSAGALLDAAIVVEELFAVEPSVALTILGTGLGLTPFLLAASEEQRAKILGAFLGDEGEPIAGFVHSEPGGTANWLEKGGAGLATTARREGSDWLINGEKVRINSANLGDFAACVNLLFQTLTRLNSTSSGQPTARGGTTAAPTCNALFAGTRRTARRSLRTWTQRPRSSSSS